jgi:hypothetical protein
VTGNSRAVRDHAPFEAEHFGPERDRWMDIGRSGSSLGIIVLRRSAHLPMTSSTTDGTAITASGHFVLPQW